MKRRSLLQGGLAALLAAPLLRSRTARADGTARRLLVFFTPNGTVHDVWRPSGSGSTYALDSDILYPLAGLEDDLLVLDGMDFTDATNHEGGMVAMLTAGGGTSVDQRIADHIGSATPYSSLELGVQTSAWGGNTQTRMSYRDGGFMTPDDDPQSVHKRLFGDLGDADLLERRQAVLGLLGEELSALHGKVESPEQGRLALHADALADVEKGLSGGSCDSIVAPESFNASSNDAFPDIARQQLDLAVQALKCGLTNVASVQLSHTVSPMVMTWLGETSGHHTLSHASDDGGVASFAACGAWFAEQFAYLIAQLKAADLFDDTVVLWATEMGDARAHVCTDVPWILTSGGVFDTGRYLSLDGEPHDRVLTSLCQAFGLSDTDFAGHGNGALEELR
ncbi:MAG: DUF1552 domain-containing protein [Proteobacteria bacterium]|nr:DUF1552 domain-containing protein [Pseudomonadota bacterium]MCP4919612.1 DUF1552 domain-containing protein [Pseudomonadota bacterium]